MVCLNCVYKHRPDIRPEPKLNASRAFVMRFIVSAAF